MRRKRSWRCRTWTIGPFMTEWRCLLQRKHKGAHLFEPDVWIERTRRMNESLMTNLTSGED